MSAQEELILEINTHIRRWQGIEMPHAAARDFAADLCAVIAAFDRLPPAEFEARLCDYRVALEELADDE